MCETGQLGEVHTRRIQAAAGKLGREGTRSVFRSAATGGGGGQESAASAPPAKPAVVAGLKGGPSSATSSTLSIS